MLCETNVDVKAFEMIYTDNSETEGRGQLGLAISL